MLAVFDDRSVITRALSFETALAHAEAAEGLIAEETAAAIAAACEAFEVDVSRLGEDAALAGVLAIPLVARLRAGLSGEAALAVHRGATSQDLADTVLMLQAKAAEGLIQADLARITEALSILAKRYDSTPALGRTLLQDALPISFGLRIAQWSAGIQEAAVRLRREAADHIRLQFGGAAGARAGLGGRGGSVAAHMAKALALPCGPPWHARRGGVAAIAAALGIVVGVLGKMARDVSLLSQNAVGEATEPASPGRGGSSAMAHKRNPTGCQVALSASIRAPGLVAAILGGLPQEEERGLGGWQAEGPALTELFLIAAGSADAMAAVAEGLQIDEHAIADNLAAAGLGRDMGESAALVGELLSLNRSDP
jgi:3-carboxy-cis,cis-muconate cycloisomerase